MEFRRDGHSWGCHRVVTPKGVLPQSATLLDVSLPIYDNEILVDVSKLQIDSASFQQLKQEAGNWKNSPNPPYYPPLPLSLPPRGGPRHAGMAWGAGERGHYRGGGGEFLAQKILAIVAERGKMHNPETNSGGVFLGRVAAVGPRHPLAKELKVGDSVVSLISLTLTPLTIEHIDHVDEEKGQVTVSGAAVVFESGLICKMPLDLPEGVVLAALDVCGAPAQVKRAVREGEKVLLIGLGKAGKAMACMAEELGGLIYGVDADADSVNWCRAHLKGHFSSLDALNPVEVSRWVHEVTRGAYVDVAINAASIEGCEMSAVTSCRDGGKVLFFGMRTSFQKVVLGAEGIGKDVMLLMGSGYVPGHAELMLNLLRSHSPLRQWFEEKYG